MIRSVIAFLLLSVLLFSATEMSASTANPQNSIRIPDPERPNQFTDSLRKVLIVEGDFISWMAFMDTLKDNEVDVLPGHLKIQRANWVIFVLALLFLFLAASRFIFPVALEVLAVAYFNDMVFGQLSKEDAVFNSWPFLLLYGFSSLSIGFILYFCAISGFLPFPVRGLQGFLLISLSIGVLFGLKIVFIRLIGFLFSIQKSLKEYVVVLYLSYFNAGILFLPIGLILAFTSNDVGKWFVLLSLTLMLLALGFRVGKVIINMISNYRFSKFYLFAYLCTLEIAPILILVKILY